MSKLSTENDGEQLNQVQLEEMFNLRYTDNDVKYMETINKPLAPPPCVRNWYSRPKRIFDFPRGQGNRSHGGRDQGDRGHWRDNRDRREWNRDYHHRDRNYHGNRHRGDRDQDRYGQRRYDDNDRGQRQTNRVHYAGVSQSKSHGGSDSWT
ncbi:hypothetical protein LSH36_740g00003 [Paralvinella palmiformis]|uniref:Uncharacterized protein n=1 Tax=Paralvinella palmiformis TaxID=53620 RepID=A0AAD9J255_9ANNE|nr:hypothetical protein LSH36_740g00003 [Paralvinella palmiformis]